MKTIEEKAKAYDEAISIAQETYARQPIYREWLAKMFPEIKESEDEKIRKELIAEVKEQIDCIPAQDCRDKEDEKRLKQLNKWYAWLEKQGEKGINGNDEEIPNSAWSEEDKEMLDTLIADYKFLSKEFRDKEHNFFIGMSLVKEDLDMIDWLKSLKDRVLPQPKQEWSEEDKLKFYDILALLRGGENCHYNTPDLFDWLKSLKDRVGHFDDGYKVGFSAAKYNQWKPSEEQLNVLNEVLNFSANHESPHWNDYIFGTLNNFIRQLKKLREE